MGNFLFKAASFLTGTVRLTESGNDDVGTEALDQAYGAFKNVVTTVLPIVISVILLVGMFFGISLGIKFAKAEDTDARDKAKGQLINLAIGVGVAAVIMIICNVLVANDVFEGLFSNL